MTEEFLAKPPNKYMLKFEHYSTGNSENLTSETFESELT